MAEQAAQHRLLGRGRGRAARGCFYGAHRCPPFLRNSSGLDADGAGRDLSDS
ncbi:hypothetical protein BURMUCF2_A2345 [Burkholderia multivorans CF2]|nr:hypothetical protein BURMUCF2_A2345 [Burkholderia multivorans CF2]